MLREIFEFKHCVTTAAATRIVRRLVSARTRAGAGFMDTVNQTKTWK